MSYLEESNSILLGDLLETCLKIGSFAERHTFHTSNIYQWKLIKFYTKSFKPGQPPISPLGSGIDLHLSLKFSSNLNYNEEKQHYFSD